MWCVSIILYENLFSLSHKNDIIDNIKLTKSNFHKFLNEIFSLDKDVNKEKKIEVFVQNRNIKFN